MIAVTRLGTDIEVRWEMVENSLIPNKRSTRVKETVLCWVTSVDFNVS